MQATVILQSAPRSLAVWAFFHLSASLVPHVMKRHIAAHHRAQYEHHINASSRQSAAKGLYSSSFFLLHSFLLSPLLKIPYLQLQAIRMEDFQEVWEALPVRTRVSIGPSRVGATIICNLSLIMQTPPCHPLFYH